MFIMRSIVMVMRSSFFFFFFFFVFSPFFHLSEFIRLIFLLIRFVVLSSSGHRIHWTTFIVELSSLHSWLLVWSMTYDRWFNIHFGISFIFCFFSFSNDFTVRRERENRKKATTPMILFVFFFLFRIQERIKKIQLVRV